MEYFARIHSPVNVAWGRFALSILISFVVAGPAIAQAPAAPMTLDEAVAAALARNETAGQADATLAGARAVVREAYGALLPRLTLTGIYTRRSEEVTRVVGGAEAVIQSQDALNGNAVAEIDLFRAPAIPLLQAARRSREAAQLERAETRRALAFETAQAYLGVLTGERLLEAARRRAELAARTADEARRRMAAGLAARSDVARAEVEAASAMLAQTDALNTLAKARNALAYLIAEDGARPLTAPTFPRPASATADAWVARALAGRADLQAREARAAALDARSAAPWLVYAPSLKAQASYRMTNEAGISGKEKDWSAALIAGWTLFDGGVAAAQASQADAAYEVAHLEAAQARRGARYEVRDALTELDAAAAAYAQAETAAAAAGIYLDETSRRFKAGLASGLEQADASVTAYQAESDVVRMRLAWQRAQLALAAAAGDWPPGVTPPKEEE